MFDAFGNVRLTYVNTGIAYSRRKRSQNSGLNGLKNLVAHASIIVCRLVLRCILELVLRLEHISLGEFQHKLQRIQSLACGSREADMHRGII